MKHGTTAAEKALQFAVTSGKLECKNVDICEPYGDGLKSAT
jgi:hypothetical protein